VAVVLGDAATGPTPAALAAIRGARTIAARQGGVAGAILLSASEDEGEIREFVAALSAAVGPIDVAIVALEEIPALSASKLAALVESLFEGSPVSAVYAADLRAAALMAAEGRLMSGAEIPFFDGIDELRADGGRLVLAGKRHEGRTRFVVPTDAARPLQVIARSDLTGSDGVAMIAAAKVVLLNDVVAPENLEDDLSRALRAAQGQLAVASLADAEFIIDVGAGVGSRDGIEMIIDPLRAALERAGVRRVMIGASRKVTQDLGMLPDACQIGQTGVSVNPKVLLAIGISGAPQHLNYIGERGVIFAFNRDPEAPIVVLNRSKPRPRVFPVLGDLFRTVPKFIAALGRSSKPPVP